MKASEFIDCLHRVIAEHADLDLLLTDDQIQYDVAGVRVTRKDTAPGRVEGPTSLCFEVVSAEIDYPVLPHKHEWLRVSMSGEDWWICTRRGCTARFPFEEGKPFLVPAEFESNQEPA